MADGPAAGLRLIDALAADGALARSYLLHSARADLLRRLGRYPEAQAAYEEAHRLVRTTPEREFLEGRLRQLG